MNNTKSPIEVFDPNQKRANRARSNKHFHDHDFLFTWAQNQVTERLKDVKRDYRHALHIGRQSTVSELKKNTSIQNLKTLDVEHADIIADPEILPLKAKSLDLITSTLELHNLNDLPGTLFQIRQALKPDGLFIAALLGGETLFELREALTQSELKLKGGISPRVHPFADKQQCGALLQRAGFNLPVVDSDIITVTYNNMFKLMNDLRFMGESNIIRERSRKNPGKALFMEAAQYYAQNFSDPDGRIRASFEVIFLIGWAPHESQQKPLKPGSAQTRLADALNTEEIKTGEDI